MQRWLHLTRPRPRLPSLKPPPHLPRLPRPRRPPGGRSRPASRSDRAVGLLLANAHAWDTLSADDHHRLGLLDAPHGPVFAWLEAQLHEHGAQPWAALREALRGHEHEAYVCAQVEQATAGNDAQTELAELAGVMQLLRRDFLEAEARTLADRVAAGDTAALEEYRRVNALLQALLSGSPV